MKRTAAPANSGVIVAAIVLALVAARLIAAGLIDLGPDEAYYLLWSRHPAWSYYDHPPMVAWWIAGGTSVFGDGPFGVRVVSVLSAIPTSLAVYATGRLLFDRVTAERAVLWINATLLVGVGAISATPDASSVMFWALVIAAYAAVTAAGSPRWWLGVGLAAGLGVLSKLTNLFLGPGILLALAVKPELRRWLVSPWMWLGGLVAVATVAPMIAWNLDHGWVTFSKQFQRLAVSGFDPLKFPEFVATQFALLNPLIAIFLGLGVVAWGGRQQRYPIDAIGLLLWTVLPLVAYLAFHSLREQVQGQWLAPAFPALALIAAAAAEAAPAERWEGLRRLAFPLGVGLSFLGLVLAANPRDILPPWLDPGQVNHGWREVAAEADRLRQENGAVWIATTQYATDAIVAYDLRATGIPVVPIRERVRYAFAPPPDQRLLGEPALLLTSADPAGFLGCFAAAHEVGSIERKSGGVTVETFAAWLVSAATPRLFADGC